MKQGSTLYYLHRDQVGSVVAVSDAAGNEVGSVRYWPFGGQKLTTGSLPTDRLFTGQIRDLNDDRFYYFKARYYDATIGVRLVLSKGVTISRDERRTKVS